MYQIISILIMLLGPLISILTQKQTKTRKKKEAHEEKRRRKQVN